MLPKVILFYVIFKLSLPPSFLTIVLFILSVALGYVILFSIEFIIGICAFWLVEIYGLYALIIWGLHLLFSGYFLPLEFYPAFLSKVAEVLPFRAIIYIPTALYSGQLAGRNIDRSAVNTTGMGNCVNDDRTDWLSCSFPQIGRSGRLRRMGRHEGFFPDFSALFLRYTSIDFCEDYFFNSAVPWFSPVRFLKEISIAYDVQSVDCFA